MPRDEFLEGDYEDAADGEHRRRSMEPSKIQFVCLCGIRDLIARLARPLSVTETEELVQYFFPNKRPEKVVEELVQQGFLERVPAGYTSCERRIGQRLKHALRGADATRLHPSYIERLAAWIHSGQPLPPFDQRLKEDPLRTRVPRKNHG